MSIPTDDSTDTGTSDTDAIAALTATLTPPKAGATPAATDDDDDDEDLDENVEGSDVYEDEDDPEADDDDESEGGEGDDESEKDEKPAAGAETPLTDDAVVKVTVDGQETEVTIGSLKRLAGQEASLTRKSQEADLVGGRAATVLQGALESVLEDLQPYSDVDWVLEGRRMDPEEFEWHRETYTRLQKRYDKIVGAAQSFGGVIAEKREAAAKDAVDAMLATVAADIPGWSDQSFKDTISYGVTSGLDQDDLAALNSPSLLKIIHKAMLFDKGKTATAEKVKAAPQKVRKGAGREAVPDAGTKSQRGFEKKIASGRMTDDDAQAALLGRWGVQSR